MELLFRPILSWPGKMTSYRRSSKFRTSYSETLQLLDKELRHLSAKNIVIQLALQPSDIRLDGVPRKDSRPTHPGVILSFDSKHGALSYPCDSFASWEDNLRAIALSLEHLRAVDRYGVTKRGEQYRGWTALPAPAASMSKEEALRTVIELSGLACSVGPDAWQTAYRTAALKHHPDRQGNPETFKRLQAAKEALETV